MQNRIHLEELRALPVGEIAALPAQQLALLQEDAEAALTAARTVKDWLDGAIALRFADQAQAARREAGKDTGTVRLAEDGVVVVAELPKRVEWDQTKLAAVVERIGAGGDDPGEYVDIAFKVPERKFTAWPSPHPRPLFAPARTVQAPASPTFKLSLGEEKEAGSMSGLPIVSADERLAERRGIKGCIFGKSGIGKTSLLWTLEPAATLFMDLEAGDLAIDGWTGDTIRPRTWSECRDFAVFIGGPNPALRDDQAYSGAHYEAVAGRFGDPAALDKYQTLFIDSITVAGRLCFQWCAGQPKAVAERSGKPDLRGAYGLHGQEMIAWLTHLQHTRGQGRLVRRHPRREARRLQSPPLPAPDRGFQDRQRAARHRRRGHHHGRDPRRRRQTLPGLRLPHAQSLRLPGQGPQRPAGGHRRTPSRPADGEDRRPRQTGEREAGVWPPRPSSPPIPRPPRRVEFAR